MLLTPQWPCGGSYKRMAGSDDMTIPDRLAARLDQALRAVREHPEHVLLPGYREVLWEALGPRVRGSHPATHEGHRRRTLLALAGARKVLPIWEAKWPGDQTPHSALAAADRILAGADSATERIAAGVGLEDLDGFMDQSFAATMAGESAVRALWTACFDEAFKPDQPLELDFTDSQLGGGDDDAASVAAIAWADGSVLDPGADRTKRLEFWEWWLTEAVPAAYLEGTFGPEHL